MGWLDSPRSVHEGNVNARFEGMEITLDFISELAWNYKKAKKALERAALKDTSLHTSSRAKIKHRCCAEDVNRKCDYLERAIELYFTKTNLLKKPESI